MTDTPYTKLARMTLWYFGPTRRKEESDDAYRARFVRAMCNYLLDADSKTVNAHIDNFAEVEWK